MTLEDLIARHAADLAQLLNTDRAVDLPGLRSQTLRAAETAPSGVAQSYATAAMYLGEHDRQPLRTRPSLIQYADEHLGDALTASGEAR